MQNQMADGDRSKQQNDRRERQRYTGLQILDYGSVMELVRGGSGAYLELTAISATAACW